LEASFQLPLRHPCFAGQAIKGNSKGGERSMMHNNNNEKKPFFQIIHEQHEKARQQFMKQREQ